MLFNTFSSLGWIVDFYRNWRNLLAFGLNIFLAIQSVFFKRGYCCNVAFNRKQYWVSVLFNTFSSLGWIVDFYRNWRNLLAFGLNIFLAIQSVFFKRGYCCNVAFNRKQYWVSVLFNTFSSLGWIVDFYRNWRNLLAFGLNIFLAVQSVFFKRGYCCKFSSGYCVFSKILISNLFFGCISVGIGAFFSSF